MLWLTKEKLACICSLSHWDVALEIASFCRTWESYNCAVQKKDKENSCLGNLCLTNHNRVSDRF